MLQIFGRLSQPPTIGLTNTVSYIGKPASGAKALVLAGLDGGAEAPPFQVDHSRYGYGGGGGGYGQ